MSCTDGERDYVRRVRGVITPRGSHFFGEGPFRRMRRWALEVSPVICRCGRYNLDVAYSISTPVFAESGIVIASEGKIDR